MKVLWIKRRVRGETSVFEGMRVWQLNGRNIWNMNIYKENIYKKHIDKQHAPSIKTGTRWTTPEHLSDPCSASVPPRPFAGTPRQPL